MSSFPWLTVIGAIPLVGALVIAIIPLPAQTTLLALTPPPHPRLPWLPAICSPSRSPW